MSKKHVEQYYNTVCDQYHQFIEELKDFEEECKNGLVAPEIIENVKQTIEPLKTNWQTLNYIMFLLNKPNRKSKQPVYSKQNRSKMNNMKTDTEVFSENESCIENMKNINKEM